MAIAPAHFKWHGGPKTEIRAPLVFGVLGEVVGKKALAKKPKLGLS
jgi:hypothetical protein